MAQQIGTLTPITRPHDLPTSRGFPWRWLFASWGLALLVVIGTLLWRFETVYAGRVHEGVSVAGIALSGLTTQEAASELAAALAPTTRQRLALQVGDRAWHPTLAELGIRVDIDATVAAANALGREGRPLQQLQSRWTLLQTGTDLTPVMVHDPAAIDAYLSRIARELFREPQDASLVIEGLTARAIPAQPGRQLDIEASRAAVLQAVATGQTDHVALTVIDRTPTLIGADEAAAQINAFLAAPLTLQMEVQEFQRHPDGSVTPLPVVRQWTIDRARLAELLRIDQIQRTTDQRAFQVHFDPTSLQTDLGRIAREIEREPRDARFDYDPNTDTLTPLIVSQDGLALDLDAARQAMDQALADNNHTIPLPVTIIRPRVSTADAEKMNIHGLAAVGRSNFSTSPSNREVNVIETARRMHGVVIPPGGEFSFNEYLGWVVEATGYEEGYIIVGNKTQVDVGGGVCQVSTTVFRAALNAGFAITERHAHGYRVVYYENDAPPGLDATVFSPWVDFKFQNDTPNYYLIESEWNLQTKQLAIKFYGADTGREVQLIGPTILKQTPPGPTIYIDTPSLPTGKLEQIDWSHPGAEVKLQRIVRDKATGQVISNDTFWSSYRSWSARFLRGTGG